MGNGPADMQPPKPADAFFSGNVVESAPDRISVSRSVMGRAPERRTFLITSATEVEGKIKPKSRVTVRYSVTEEGNVALSILVRDHLPRPENGKKK
jgi:hypothetical protein